MPTPVLPLGIAWFAAVALALLDGRRPLVGWLAVAALAASFSATLALTGQVLEHGSVETQVGGWPEGIAITLRADALGVMFALVSAGVMLAALTHEVVIGVHERSLPAMALFATAGLTGLFLTADAFNFYVFFEVSMTAAFVLASYGRGDPQTRPALIFTVVNLLGSVLFLGGIAALYRVTGTLDMRAITARMDLVEPTSAMLIAVIVFVAFSLKLGLFPFHFWVPAVYGGSLPAVAAILSGALANIGSYGLLRFGGSLLARELELGSSVVLLLGCASILYGAVLATVCRTSGEVLAYSSIGQAGYILLALSIGGPLGYSAAVLVALVNPLIKTLLFLATDLRGAVVGAAFAIGGFAVAGVPPSVGFFSKLALFQAGVAAGSPLLLMVLFLGGALSFIYMFRAYQRDFWLPRERVACARPIGQLPVAALAVLIVGLGIWPEPLLAASQQAANVLVAGP